MKPTVTKATDKAIEKNLRKWFELASDEQVDKGIDWYVDAKEFTRTLANEYGIDSYTVATVVSCLSPNNKWERNKIDADSVINAYSEGISPEEIKVCTYNANKFKAFRALDGELIAESAPKTHAFAMNVGLNSAEHITIDKWHLRACLFGPEDGIKDCVESCTNVQYRRVEKITAKLAKEYGIKGFEFQAIIWVTIKDAWNR